MHKEGQEVCIVLLLAVTLAVVVISQGQFREPGLGMLA